MLQWPADVGALPRGDQGSAIVGDADERSARPRPRLRDRGDGGETQLGRSHRVELQRHAGRGRPAQCGSQQRIRLGGREQAHGGRGARHVVLDELQGPAARRHLHQRRCGRHRDGVELRRQAIDVPPVLAGDASQQGRRRFWTVALGAAALDPRGALRDQALQCTVGIGPGQPRRTGDGVAGAGTAREEYLVDEALSGGEAEGGQVDGWHGRSMSNYAMRSNPDASAGGSVPMRPDCFVGPAGLLAMSRRAASGRCADERRARASGGSRPAG